MVPQLEYLIWCFKLCVLFWRKEWTGEKFLDSFWCGSPWLCSEMLNIITSVCFFWHWTEVGYLQRSPLLWYWKKKRIYISVHIKGHHWKSNILPNNILLKAWELSFLPFLLYIKIMSCSSFVYIVWLIFLFFSLFFPSDYKFRFNLVIVMIAYQPCHSWEFKKKEPFSANKIVETLFFPLIMETLLLRNSVWYLE